MTPLELLGDVGLITLVSIVKTGILLLGGFVTLMSYRAFRRTGDRGLLYLAVGFGFVTLGTFLAGAVYNVLDFDLVEGILLESLLVFTGFAVIAYSLVHRRRA